MHVWYLQNFFFIKNKTTNQKNYDIMIILFLAEKEIFSFITNLNIQIRFIGIKKNLFFEQGYKGKGQFYNALVAMDSAVRT